MYTKYKNAGAILHAQLLQIPEIILYAWTYPSVKLRCVNGSPLDDSSSEMRSRCKSKEANAGQQPNEIHGWTANIHCCKKSSAIAKLHWPTNAVEPAKENMMTRAQTLIKQLVLLFITFYYGTHAHILFLWTLNFEFMRLQTCRTNLWVMGRTRNYRG